MTSKTRLPYILMPTILAFAAECFIGYVAHANDTEPSVQLSWDAAPTIFPERWRQDPFYAAAKPVVHSEKTRAVAVIRHALGKYPKELIQRTLNHVYLVGELTFYQHQKFSGTASSQDLYLVAGSEEEGYTDRFIESRFHAEYSTLLLNLYLERFDRTAWEMANPPEFRYLGDNSWDATLGKKGGARAIDLGQTSLVLRNDSESRRYGFLTQYSQSSVENDVNEYAAELFLNDPAFWRNVDNCRGCSTKCALVIDFYHAISPIFTREYFCSLASPW